MADEHKELHSISSGRENEAIRHLKEALASGTPWHIALLESIGLWTLPEETHCGRHYRYLIDGEAFDWLLVAERLCQETNGFIPEQAQNDLLFFGILPVSQDEFRQIIGNVKYRAYLNYLYGVTVESFLVLAVEEEIRKERQALVFHIKEDGAQFDSFKRVYGASQQTLLRRFREQKRYPQVRTVTTSELHEFTYWLFKYRLGSNDKEKVASDTKKGLDYLNSVRVTRLPAGLRPEARDAPVMEAGRRRGGSQ